MIFFLASLLLFSQSLLAQFNDPNEPNDSIIEVTFPEKEFTLRLLKKPKRNCLFAVFSNQTQNQIWVNTYKNQDQLTRFIKEEDKSLIVTSSGRLIDVEPRLLKNAFFTLKGQNVYLKSFENQKAKMVRIPAALTCSL